MASLTIIKRRIAFRESALEKLYDAYEQLVAGKVKSYQIDDRTLTRLDLPALSEEISKLEGELDELEEMAAGSRRRRAYAVLPRDW